MNQNRPTLSRMLPLAAGAFSLIAALIHGAMLLLYTDATSVDGLYTTLLFKQGLPTVLFVLLCTIFTALTILLPFLLLKKDPTSAPQAKDGTAMLFARAAAGIGMLAVGITYFILSPTATPYDKTAENSTLVLAFLVFSVVGAFYFILPALLSVKSGLQFLLGTSALLALGCELLLTHYFMLDFLSSPTRVFAVFGYGSLTLFLLFELRALAYKKPCTKVRTAFALAAFFLNVTDALPRLALSFVGAASFQVNLTSFHTLMRLLLAVYAFVSILPLLSARQKCENAKEDPLEQEQETLASQECLEERAASQENDPSAPANDQNPPLYEEPQAQDLPKAEDVFEN